MNYPTDQYESFNDCDVQYLDNLLQNEMLYPAWASPNDLTKATNLSRNIGFGKSIQGYFVGTTSGPCIQPCTQTSIKAVYQFSDKPFGTNQTTINLNFDPDVKVITHAFAKFQPVEVLQVDRN